jgi:peptidyl-prolyl cis-trans isomerase D
VRGQLAQEERNYQAEDRFFELAEQLETFTFENPDTLSIAAEQTGLEVKTSDFFSIGNGEGIAQYPRVRQAAFSPEVLDEGLNSVAMEVETNHLVVVRVKDRKAPAIKPLDEVKDQIAATLKQEIAAERIKEQGEEILSRVKSGESPEEAVKELDQEWQKPGYIGRNDTTLDRAILDAMFKAAAPAEQQPTYVGKQLASGSYAVFGVYAVRDGDVSRVDDEARAVLRDELVRSRGIGQYTGVMDTWKQSADIVTYPEKI